MKAKSETMNFLRNKSILVTGATGLVGTNLLLRLKDTPGIRIKGIYHKKEPLVHSKNIIYEKADLTDAKACKKVTQGIDYVLMFAANISRRSKDQSYLLKDLTINFQMLNAAYTAGAKKVIWLSSATVYPESVKPLREEQMFGGDPPDTYFGLGWMTRYVETLFKMYATKLNRPMAATILRCTAIYGEYDDFDLSTCHVLSALISKVVQRQDPIEVWGTGGTRRDFVYVGDVVDACLLALEKMNGFEVFNIGFGRSYSIKELLETILDIDNHSGAKIIYDKSKSIKTPDILVNCDKAKEVIGFSPKTSIKEGISKTIKWYRDNLLSKE